MGADKVKIAVLFRGPIRPDLLSVMLRVNEFMQHFNGVENVKLTTYLATWRTWKQFDAAKLLSLDLFDNVLMLTEPSDERIEKITPVKVLPSGQTIRKVYNMYYQVKTALDIIREADDYDFIVNTRTDLIMQMGEHTPYWFDPNAYTAPHIPGVFAPHAPHIPANEMFMCDQFGIATPSLMHAAWDYGTLEDLGRRIDVAKLPEHVLQNIIAEKHIPVKAPPFLQWKLDPRRNA